MEAHRHVEPQIEPPRETEALLIAMDTSVPKETFEALRKVAFRLARTRLLYPINKDDLIGILAAGSRTTDNPLAEQAPGGYEGIQMHVPLITACLRAVRTLDGLPHGGRPTNLLNVLDVAGDYLVSTAALRSRKKRLLLFTSDESALCSLPADDDDDFISTCDLYQAFENQIRIDVILQCSVETADSLEASEEAFDAMEPEEEDAQPVQLTSREALAKARSFCCPNLIALVKATSGIVLPLSDAIPLADVPDPKRKRASVKFHGVLDIANTLQIPVKRYSYILESRHAPSKKISWEESKKLGQFIPVLIETNRVASTKDDTPLQPEEIINAFSYGPDLVPEQNPVHSYAWSMHMDRGLHVIGFVAQASIPQHLFTSRVDVVIAMKDSPEAIRLLRTLVLALQKEKLGILARSVVLARGGPPTLCYLWPRVEYAADKNKIRNCYLFAVDVPMREDVRDLPFASLQDVVSEIPKEDLNAMDELISSSMLDGDGRDNEGSDNEETGDNDEDRRDAFSSVEYANPNLDWFNICIVHRALQGPNGSSLPELSEWHKCIMTPGAFLSKSMTDSRETALRKIKTSFPIAPAKKRERKGRQVPTALHGDMASIKDYLPEDGSEWGETDRAVAFGEANGDGDADDNDSYQDALERPPETQPIWNNQDLQEDVISAVTNDAPDQQVVTDVSEKTPVQDFKHLVKKGKFRFAALSLQVVLKRLIRGDDNIEKTNNAKAIKCLQALRKACCDHKEGRFFNELIVAMVQAAERDDQAGERTAAFFRYVGSKRQVPTTLDVIPVDGVPSFTATATQSMSSAIRPNGRGAVEDTQYQEFVDEMSETIANLTKRKPAPTPYLSQMNDSD